MPWPRNSEIVHRFDPALPEYLRAQFDDLTDVLAGHIDRDNVKPNVLTEALFAPGSTNKIPVKATSTNTSTGADARDGLLLFDEAIFGADGAFIDFTSGDSEVTVTADVVLLFDPTAIVGASDEAFITFGVMVDGQVVARGDRVRVYIPVFGGGDTAYSFHAEGSIRVPAGSRRAIAFVEMKDWNGSQIGSIKLGERFIMVEEMVR